MSLELRNVTKKFGSFTAVDDLSISIPENEMFGFLGGNGAGKTTTFRMILGILESTAGQITWDGKPINYSTSPYIGYLPEERGLYPKLKVRDQLIYLARLRGMEKKAALSELEYWLNRFKVPEYMDKKVEELSKGNQQKIQFISAVLHKPKLLILDEPFSGLDPVNVEQLKSAVVDLKNKGTSIVFSSHRMEHVEELCQHLCIMHKGKPVVHGSLKDIKRSFGKKNVTIHADFDLTHLIRYPGVLKLKETAEGVSLQIEGEEVAERILNDIVGKGFIRKFALEEPSLNDIFIEKVGASLE
ncbi:MULTISPECIES: ABC transporter ATP-binding protein [Niallia]|uniref:Sodium ABC transporter ATP-binding protein n=1 Tax=Niallia circulans TaxID=1397 RepID=A0A0J1II10_NIACI|nr:ABC transporter ATP-binding protein [Niallia circulans]KLV25634.1 sodium ABC transporter ATP-binding protein [Niallia circulans]MCM2982753.1 ABC transporter ATP-binding protein [Niallia circulans]MDR4315974.1 ABC transporter ATP-binding protein [Niallia circulans]MED3837692.1 ABC transporter ATP-binding protein [Niallia circulans]MED4244763.1 ABC transporter ATP-binding protein [Niallia circulans]